MGAGWAAERSARVDFGVTGFAEEVAGTVPGLVEVCSMGWTTWRSGLEALAKGGFREVEGVPGDGLPRSSEAATAGAAEATGDSGTDFFPML